jgi:hypothetical protein
MLRNSDQNLAYRRRTSNDEICAVCPVEGEAWQRERGRRLSAAAVPLVNDGPRTISWFAIQMGPSSFAIFDTFDDEAGRDAHRALSIG